MKLSKIRRGLSVVLGVCMILGDFLNVSATENVKSAEVIEQTESSLEEAEDDLSDPDGGTALPEEEESADMDADNESISSESDRVLDDDTDEIAETTQTEEVMMPDESASVDEEKSIADDIPDRWTKTIS